MAVPGSRASRVASEPTKCVSPANASVTARPLGARGPPAAAPPDRAAAVVAVVVAAGTVVAVAGGSGAAPPAAGRAAAQPTSTIASTSTGTPRGSAATPTAARAWRPASPNTSPNSSL